jgi:hypothetical protein
VSPDDAADPAAGVPPHAGHRHARGEPGAGSYGRVHQQLVEHATTRREQEPDAGSLLDGQGRGGQVPAERDLPHRRRTGGEHVVEQPPAGELDHTTSGDAMRRQGVAGEAGAVDEHDVVAHPSQQQGGGGAGAAGSHDDDVVAGVLEAGHTADCAPASPRGLGGDVEVRWRSRPGPISTRPPPDRQALPFAPRDVARHDQPACRPADP